MKRGPYKPRTKPTKKGAGRPNEGRVKNTLTMLPAAWIKIDLLKGEEYSRGEYVERLLKIPSQK